MRLVVLAVAATVVLSTKWSASVISADVTEADTDTSADMVDSDLVNGASAQHLDTHSSDADDDEYPSGLPDELLDDVATMVHPPLNEVSGMVRSRTYPDVWWVHNDSGDVPRIFAVNAQGQTIMPGWLKERYYTEDLQNGKEPWPGIEMLNSANVDWEDIAIDGGRLYIADVGNNGNARRDLGIYVVNEPNPEAIDRARPTSFIPVVYPDQEGSPPEDWRFDCEAVFVSEGRLYLLTKFRADGRWDKITYGTRLYRLDTTHTDVENELTLVSRLEDLPIIPTAADLSPDGQRLAVLSYDGVWVFEAEAGSDDWLAGKIWRLDLAPHRLKQAEAICWDDDTTLRIANEQREIFTLDTGRLKPVR